MFDFKDTCDWTLSVGSKGQAHHVPAQTRNFGGPGVQVAPKAPLKWGRAAVHGHGFALWRDARIARRHFGREVEVVVKVKVAGMQNVSLAVCRNAATGEGQRLLASCCGTGGGATVLRGRFLAASDTCHVALIVPLGDKSHVLLLGRMVLAVAESPLPATTADGKASPPCTPADAKSSCQSVLQVQGAPKVPLGSSNNEQAQATPDDLHNEAALASAKHGTSSPATPAMPAVQEMPAAPDDTLAWEGTLRGGLPGGGPATEPPPAREPGRKAAGAEAPRPRPVTGHGKLALDDDCETRLLPVTRARGWKPVPHAALASTSVATAEVAPTPDDVSPFPADVSLAPADAVSAGGTGSGAVRWAVVRAFPRLAAFEGRTAEMSLRVCGSGSVTLLAGEALGTREGLAGAKVLGRVAVAGSGAALEVAGRVEGWKQLAILYGKRGGRGGWGGAGRGKEVCGRSDAGSFMGD